MREDQRKALITLLRDVSDICSERCCDEYEITVGDALAKELEAAELGSAESGRLVSSSTGSMCNYFADLLEVK